MQVPNYVDSFDKDAFNKVYNQAAKVINGSLGFGDGITPDNISGAWSNVTTPAVSGEQFTLEHNLGRIPVGYLLVSTDKPTSLYNGYSAWTDTTISLKSTATDAMIRVFIF